MKIVRLFDVPYFIRGLSPHFTMSDITPRVFSHRQKKFINYDMRNIAYLFSRMQGLHAIRMIRENLNTEIFVQVPSEVEDFYSIKYPDENTVVIERKVFPFMRMTFNPNDMYKFHIEIYYKWKEFSYERLSKYIKLMYTFYMPNKKSFTSSESRKIRERINIGRYNKQTEIVTFGNYEPEKLFEEINPIGYYDKIFFSNLRDNEKQTTIRQTR